MSIVTRLASPPEYRKLAPWFTDAGQAAPTLADMVLLAEDEGELCGALRVVMGRGLIRLDGVIARDDEVLQVLLNQSARWVGREACWALVSEKALPVYLATGFELQAVAPDTLVAEMQQQALIAVMRPVPQEAEATEEIAVAATGGSALPSA
ncbi:hypothetical protein HQ393_14855 [Chitinibacter bivalviorum]|uniref:N-acetyltransferase domain-containing protein n=1 Tax=Chitinibacter bivalviorum TaxID=2739434 RepID=A0A7H9BLU0_9NEIS|nr:hypothetical protein [Chitinibacter bivalviorum]QLG89419.1 hypothetical protein HQ393_14855 [Chitinibacter bivalviorum]